MIHKRDQFLGWAAIILGLVLLVEAAGIFLVKILLVLLAVGLVNYGLTLLGKSNIKIITWRMVDDLRNRFF